MKLLILLATLSHPDPCSEESMAELAQLRAMFEHILAAELPPTMPPEQLEAYQGAARHYLALLAEEEAECEKATIGGCGESVPENRRALEW